MRIALTATLAIGLVLTPIGTLDARDRPPVKTTNAKAMAGLSQVVVSSFSVAFVTEKTDAAFAGRRNSGKAMGAIAKARLTGVSAADYQAIADAAYADFARRMTTAGFTIGDRAAMIANKEMAKIQYVASGAEGSLAFGKDSKAKAVFYGPSAFGPAPLLKGETGDSGVAALGGMFGGLKAFTAMGGPATSKSMYAVLNKQPTLSVLYVIDFADADRYVASVSERATVDLTASLAVVETLSKVDTINANGGTGSIVIAQPIAVPGNFGRMQDTTTGGQRLDNVAGAIIGGLFGSGSNTYTHITFSADPTAYRSGAISAVGNANAVVVAELSANR